MRRILTLSLVAVLLLAVGAWRWVAARRDAGGQGTTPAVVHEGPLAPRAVAELRAPGEEPQAGSIEFKDPADADARMAVEAAPAEVRTTLTVEVVDPDGVPDKRPRISLASPESASRMLLADEGGRATFDVEAGVELKLTVYAAPPGREPSVRREAPLAPGERRNVVVELEPLASLDWFGRVIDGEGRPIEGAQVWLGESGELLWDTDPPARRDPEGLRLAATSDRDGFVRVRADDLAELALRVEAQGFAWCVVALGPGTTPTAPQDVRLLRAASLTVELGPLTGQELAEAVVVASVDGFALPTDSGISPPLLVGKLWSTRPDTTGRARFDTLPPHIPVDVQLHGLDPRGRPWTAPLALEPDEARTLDLRRGVGASVVGRVRHVGGAALGDVELWLVPSNEGEMEALHAFEEGTARKARSDAGGRFVFEDIGDGSWAVGPSPIQDWLSLRTPFEVRGGMQVGELEVVASHGLHLEGRVVTQDGRPVPGCIVGALHLERRHYLHVVSDAEGAFRIGPLQAGRHRLSATTQTARDVPCAAPEPLEVEAGASGLTLVCPPAFVLEVHSGLRGAGGYMVSTRRADGVVKVVARGALELDGSLRTPPLAEGRYAVSLWTDDRFAVAHDVALGPAGHELELAPRTAPILRVRYLGRASAVSLQVLQGGYPLREELSLDGRTFRLAVPEGRLHVVLIGHGDGEVRKQERDVDVSADGLELEFTD